MLKKLMVSQQRKLGQPLLLGVLKNQLHVLAGRVLCISLRRLIKLVREPRRMSVAGLSLPFMSKPAQRWLQGLFVKRARNKKNVEVVECK
jgi:hypothetical protein